MGSLNGPLGDIWESFVKNVFCDIVKPKVGSILKVDLVGSGLFYGSDIPFLGKSDSLCHTGVYIGNDQIVELTEIDGNAVIRIVSAEKFLNGDGNIPVRTGCFIYVACGKDKNGDCYAIGEQEIADRAKAAVGQYWNGNYGLTDNNCHMFCQYCITGRKDGNSCLLSGIEDALKKAFHLDEVHWRSTGNTIC